MFNERGSVEAPVLVTDRIRPCLLYTSLGARLLCDGSYGFVCCWLGRDDLFGGDDFCRRGRSGRGGHHCAGNGLGGHGSGHGNSGGRGGRLLGRSGCGLHGLLRGYRCDRRSGRGVAVGSGRSGGGVQGLSLIHI